MSARLWSPEEVRRADRRPRLLDDPEFHGPLYPRDLLAAIEHIIRGNFRLLE